MAVPIGNIGPFDEKSEKCSDYADRFEAYVAANDIDNDKKVNVFLAVIGPDAYKLLKNVWENPNTKTFTRLSQLLQGHFEPAPILGFHQSVIKTKNRKNQLSQESGIR